VISLAGGGRHARSLPADRPIAANELYGSRASACRRSIKPVVLPIRSRYDVFCGVFGVLLIQKKEWP
jgi:hypothetical protein